MIRVFDLAMEEEAVAEFLNRPSLLFRKISWSCSQETGFTTVTIEYEIARTAFKRKRKRFIRRFELPIGEDSELNDVLSDSRYAVIRKESFLSDEGMIILVDYEMLQTEREDWG